MNLSIFSRVALVASLVSFAQSAFSETRQPLPIKVDIGQPVVVDLTDASSLTRTGLMVTWSWESRPATSVAEFSNTNALNPIVTPDVSGTYIARADFIAPETGEIAETLTVEIGTDNVSPVSLIRARGFPSGPTPLLLDGSGSFDVDGDALTYAWSVLTQPAGSNPIIAQAEEPLTLVTPDIAGDYSLGLTVQDTNGRVSTLAEFEMSYAPSAASVRNVAPVASFGFDQLVAHVGERILIDAYRSTDIDGDALSPSVTVVSSPTGAIFDLTTDENGLSTFVTDTDGDYLVALAVTDRFFIDTDQLLIRVGANTNARPVAKIADITVAPLDVAVILDGTQSYDLNGDFISYTWSIVHQPASSTASLTDADMALAAIVPDVPGDYIMQLQVSDASGAGVPVTTLLRVEGGSVTANAGRDSLLDDNGQGLLDGTFSAGVGLEYFWTAAGLTGSNGIGEIENATASQTTVGWTIGGATSGDSDVETARFHDIIQEHAVYHIKRDAPDGQCQFDTRLPADISGTFVSEPVSIALTSRGKQAGPEGDVLVWEIENKNNHTRDVTLEDGVGILHGTFIVPGRTSVHVTTGDIGKLDMSAFVAGTEVADARVKSSPFNRNNPVCVGETAEIGAGVVQLIVQNGFGISVPDTVFVGDAALRPVLSHGAKMTLMAGETTSLTAAPYGYDGNGDILAFDWSLISRPLDSTAQVSLTADSAEFTPDLVGLYLIQLAATDDGFDAEPVVFAFEVLNSAPTAVAAAIEDTFVGDSLVLDGSGSFDPDGHVITYEWSIVSAPAQSAAVIVNSQTALASFTPDRRGDYVFELFVSDYALASPAAQTNLTVPNRAPIAVLEGSVEGDVELGNQIDFTALGSSDPDADPLTYTWAVLVAPEGSTAALIESSVGGTSFVADIVGAYTVELAVSDGLSESFETYAFNVRPKNHPPVLGGYEAEYFMEVGEHLVVNLTATDSDSDDTLNFYAIDLPLPEGMTMAAQTGELKFDPETGQEGDYNLVFGVSDGIKTSTARVIIHVLPADAADTTIAGRVLNADDYQNGIETPISGIPVRLDGAALETITALDGTFVFTALSGTDDVILVEPSSAGGPGGYTSTSRSVVITANQEKTLTPDFLISPMTGLCVTVDPSQTTVLQDDNLGLNVSLPAGSIKNASDGENYAGEVCLGQLPTKIDLPMMPANTNACRIYSIEAPGATFNQGISISAPNLDNLPGGANTELWRLYSGFGRFLTTTQGTVSVDGNTVSASATNFNAGTLFTFLPQRPSVTLADDQPQSKHILSLFEGDLAQSYSPVSYQSFGQNQTLGINYHSSTSDPRPILAANVKINETAGLPVSMSTVISLGGNVIGGSASWNPRVGADGSTHSLLGEEVTLYQSSAVDATGYTTGRYGYNFAVEANYDCSTVAADVDGKMFVRNDSESPIGAGWSPDVERIYPGTDGSVTIVDDAEIVTFDPETGLTDVDEILTWPIKWGFRTYPQDLDGNGLIDVVFHERDEGRVRVLYNFGDREFYLTDGVILGTAHRSPNLTTGLSFPDINSLTPVVIGDSEQRGFIATYQYSNTTKIFTHAGIDQYDLFGEYFKYTRSVDSVAGDFNNDGHQDVLVSLVNDKRILWGDGTGLNHFNAFDFAGSNDTEVVALDFNKDGLTDFAIRDRSAGLQMVVAIPPIAGEEYPRYRYVNLDGDNSIGGSSPNNFGDKLAVLDLDKDGWMDIAYSSGTGIRAYFNQAKSIDDSFLVEEVRYALPAGFDSNSFLTAFDVDGDGDKDLIVDENFDGVLDSTRPQKVALFRNEGTRAPLIAEELDPSLFLDGDRSRGLQIGDIDNDGSLDLISASIDTLQITFFKSGQNGKYAAPLGEFSTLVGLENGGWERRYKDGNVSVFDENGYQIAKVDANGNRVEYAYDTDGKLASWTDQVGNVTTWAYHPDGSLASITDPFGGVTEFEYLNQVMTTIVEPSLSTVSFEYDENNRLVALSDPNGNTSQFAYNGEGKFQGAAFADSSSIKNQVASSLGLVDGLGNSAALNNLPYVAPGDRYTTVTDQKGNTTQIELNEYGTPVKVTDQIGRTTIIERNDENLVVRVERPIEGGTRVDEMSYDDLANLLSITEGAGSSVERTTLYTYEDTYNKVLTETDADGFVTAYSYDTKGNPLSVTNAAGGVRTYSYASNGKLLSSTDENGNETAYEYNAQYNVETKTYADGSVTEYAYDPQGRLGAEAEAFGTDYERRIYRTYDAKNRVLTVAVSDNTGIPDDGTTSYDYDANGNVIKVTDETGLVTEFTFDAVNRITAMSDPAEGTIQRIYNAAGEVVQHINSAGETHNYSYDAVSRLVGTIDPAGFSKEFGYDLRDNIASVTDGRGGQTGFTFDALDRMITRTNPLNEVMVRGYDARDNLTALTREDGLVETATYDGLGRRTSVVTPDNTLTYAYDAASNLTQANDDDSAVSFAYDLRNRLASTTTDGTVGPQPQVTISYTYDALDRRTSMSDSLGGTTAYAYDVEDRLTDLTAPWGTVYNFGYDFEGRRTSLTSTSGRNTSYGYTNGLLTSLSHVQSGVALTDLAYAYDVDAQLTAIKDNLDPTKSLSIAYDDLNRLLQVAEGIPVIDGGVPIPVEDYAYDEEGNRLASHLSNLYASNAHNQLEVDDTYTYAYDTRGNRISRTAKADGAIETYTYDSQNRLIGYASETTTASYAYDAMERRIAKTVDGAVTAYVYDASMDDPLAHDDILMEWEGGAFPVLTRRWMHSNAVDEPVGLETYTASSGVGSGIEHAMYADRQGSVLWVTDPATGEVAAAYEYDGYGAITQTQGVLQQPYGYTGREFDAESGLYYYRARSYDPKLGMFVQSDPIGFGGGTINIYGYSEQNPYGNRDPSGLSSSPGFAVATAGGVAATGDIFGTIGVGLINGPLWQILKGLTLAVPAAIILNSDSNDAQGDRNAECHAMGDRLAEAAAKEWSACVMAANVSSTRATKTRLLKRCDQWAAIRNSEIMEEVAACIAGSR